MRIIRGLIDYVRLHIHRKYYSLKHIKRYQLKQIKKMYNYAIHNSPFYRELYNGYPLNTMEDFYQLPTINKPIMMENFTDLNTCGIVKEEVMKHAVDSELKKEYLGYYQDEYVIGLSSGTSGNKGIYITPKHITERLPFVFLARSGLPLTLLPFKILFMLRVFSQGFDDINSRFITLKYLSTMEDIQTVIDTINDKSINVLMAPPSFIRKLLPYVDDITVDIKQVVTYAEVLEVEDKEHFEQVFHANVIEIYQASEGQIGSACKEGYLHINEDFVFIELYDEEGNLIDTPNTVGHKMILTNLVNKAQPLIRYEMNDMIVLDETCSCGSQFRRIKKVLGRHDDLIYFYTTNHVKTVIFPDLFVRWIIISSENIREFQVHQDTINEVTIYIEPLHKEDSELSQQVTMMIQQGLQEFDITEPIIHIELTDIELPKEKNKYKRFISKVRE